VELKLCPRCRKPFLATKEHCPSCPEPPTLNQESWANLGCLLVTFLPIFGMILFWLLMFFGLFMR
jgi:hypothetical protein